MNNERFYFNDGNMNSITGNFSKEVYTLSDIETSVRTISRNLNSNMKGMGDVQRALNKIASSVDKCETGARNLSNGITEVRRKYNWTEDKIADISLAGTVIRNVIGYVSSALGTIIDGRKGTINGWDYSYGVNPSVKAKVKLYEYDHKNGFQNKLEYNEKTGKWEKKKGSKQWIDGKCYEYDEKTGEYKEAEAEKPKSKKEKLKEAGMGALTSATIAKASISKEGSLAKAEGSISGKYGDASAYAKFGTAQANAAATLTTGCATLSAGASVTALELGANGKLGNDNFNVHGDVKVKALSAEAKGEIKAGWLNEKGEFSPAIKAGGSVEAVAASVEGTAGATIAGAEVNVKGQVGVGVGAHANVGYENGKIKLDVGAYVGVGGSVSLEIDVSKPVKAIANGAKEVGKAAVNAGKKIWSGIKSLF